MSVFFSICDDLGITPMEFFDTGIAAPAKTHELLNAIRGLSGEQMDILISLAKGLERPKP